MTQTAIIIGLPETCRRLEKQLELLPRPLVVLGWVLPTDAAIRPGASGRLRRRVGRVFGSPPRTVDPPAGTPLLGGIEELEAIVERGRPDLALVTLPAVMNDLIVSVRTRLRRLGLPDRFMPTLEDQIAGVGPRSRSEIDLTRLLDRDPRAIDEAAARGVIEGNRVLITGAGGSIGSELARLAARYEPRELILIDRSENALFEIDRQIARRHRDLERRALLHDVVDAEGTLQHFDRFRPGIVFHAAAHKHVPIMEEHPALAVDNNLFGTKSVADAADAVGARRVVIISTDKAVNPSSIMGATKRLAELYVQHLNERSATGFAMVRFGNVLGSTGSVLDVWSKEIAEGGPLTVTDPNMTRFFMTLAEAAALVIQSAALLDPAAPCGEIFVLDMGKPIRVLDLARRFIALHGLEPAVSGGGEPLVDIVFTGPRPGEKLHEELALSSEELRPTLHPEIRLCRPAAPEADFVRRMISVLSPDRRNREATAVAATVRRLASTPMQPAAA